MILVIYTIVLGMFICLTHSNDCLYDNNDDDDYTLVSLGQV